MTTENHNFSQSSEMSAIANKAIAEWDDNGLETICPLDLFVILRLKEALVSAALPTDVVGQQ